MSAEPSEHLDPEESPLPKPLDLESLRSPWPSERIAAAIAVLESLRTEGDPEEQRETLEYLKRALDEARPPGQRLFEDEYSTSAEQTRQAWSQPMSDEPHEQVGLVESPLPEPVDREALRRPWSPERIAKAIAVLESLRTEGDPEEQRETGEYLMRALDQDRPPGRKLFPWIE